MQSRVILDMRGIVKRFRAGVRGCSASALALDGVEIRVREGERVGILGPPGSGKSTLLLCAAGLVRPDEGVVRWRGNARLTNRCGIALADDREALYAFLTVRETLDHHITTRELPGEEREAMIARAIERTALGAVAECRLSLLPPGTRRRVGLAQALLGDPWLVLLDGTLDGLPHADASIVRTALGAACGARSAMLIASRDEACLTGIATRIIALRAPGSIGQQGEAARDEPLRPQRIALVRERDDRPRR